MYGVGMFSVVVCLPREFELYKAFLLKRESSGNSVQKATSSVSGIAREAVATVDPVFFAVGGVLAGWTSTTGQGADSGIDDSQDENGSDADPVLNGVTSTVITLGTNVGTDGPDGKKLPTPESSTVLIRAADTTVRGPTLHASPLT